MILAAGDTRASTAKLPKDAKPIAKPYTARRSQRRPPVGASKAGVHCSIGRLFCKPLVVCVHSDASPDLSDLRPEPVRPRSAVAQARSGV